MTPAQGDAVAECSWCKGIREEGEICACNAPTSEAAAMRERAAKVCEDQMQIFLSPQYATGQPLSSITERLACVRCAAAIRALPLEQGADAGE